MTQQVLFIIKTDREISYLPLNVDNIQTRKRYQPMHHIGIGLALRKFDRNNQMINLLSALNYNLSIGKPVLQMQQLFYVLLLKIPKGFRRYIT